ncbi:MAG: hypothetical protein M1549_02825 [Candidatus Dependentiae bacterium]|nr:hypothetical protein [Candidatus Dependentiae bacterium]
MKMTKNKIVVFAAALAIMALVPTTSNGMLAKLEKTFSQQLYLPCAKFLSTCLSLKGPAQKNILTTELNEAFKTTNTRQWTNKKSRKSEHYNGQKSRFKASFNAAVLPGLFATGVFAAGYYLVKRKKKKDGTIILPSCQEIAKILDSLGLDHFNEKTKFAEQLGGKKITPINLSLDFEIAMHDYAKRHAYQSVILNILEQRRPCILRALLAKYPEEAENLLKELKMGTHKVHEKKQ